MMGLTPSQRDCLYFIRTHLREKGVSPSYSEIKQALGFNSKSGVHQLLRGLMQRGHIVMGSGYSRAIKLVQPKEDHAADCPCAACPARSLQYQQIIKGLQTEAKFAPGVVLTGTRPLSNATRAHWKVGFPQNNAVPRKRSALPSEVR